MTRISKYTEIITPDPDDLLLGTDVENDNATKNFTIQSIVDLFNASEATNITYTPSPTNGAIISSTGNDATIPLANSTNAGLFSPIEKSTLASLATLSVTATSPITSSGGLNSVISTSMTSGKLIGRSTTGTGVMEQITVGDGLSLIGGTLMTSLSALSTFVGTTQTDGPQQTIIPLTDVIAPTGWSGTSFATGYTHTSGGGVTPLIATDTILDATIYRVSYTISNRTTGNISISIGGKSKSGIAGSSSFSLLSISSSSLVITPSSTFNGKVVITLRIVTASSPIIKFLSSTASLRNEFRYSAAGLFIGQGSGAYTIGGNNTFIGNYSGSYNIGGFSNTFLGSDSGYSNEDGGSNTFLGSNSGYYNISGNSNSFLGVNSGYNNVSGYSNTFIGSFSGISNVSGIDNTFLGAESGFSNTSGWYNTFLGDSSGYSNTTGTSNTFIGFQTGYNNANGGNNVILGSYAGNTNTIGSNNILVGYGSDVSSNSDENSIVIGTSLIGLGTNTTAIGSASTTSTTLGGAVSIQTGTLAIPNASAQLDVVSTTKGFLPPRMTTTQINAIVSPANGLVVFNTTLNTICFFTTAWQKVTSTAM